VQTLESHKYYNPGALPLVMAPSAFQLDQYPTLSFDNPVKPLEYEIVPTDTNHGINDVQHLIRQALKQRVDTVNSDTCEAGEEDAFFVADLGQVYRQHMRWKLHLPRVKPHYGTPPLSRLS
jgi:ornithine decarboxylase